jgi:hypothetical protein
MPGDAAMIVGVSPAVRSAEESRVLGATNSRGDHLRRMAAPRTLRLLTMLAVLLMPFGMLRGTSAEAMEHHVSMTMSAGHCAGMPAKEKKAETAPCCDCMVACAAIHSKDACIEPMAPVPMAAEAARLKPAIHGLHPEAATPPPRIA